LAFNSRPARAGPVGYAWRYWQSHEPGGPGG